MSAVAKRYARAAVQAASEAGGPKAVDSLAEGLSVFADALKTSTELREVVANPALREKRDDALTAVVKKLKLYDQAARLVVVLANSDRIEIFDEVAADVLAIADEQAGRMRATVTSAIELTDKQTERLASALEKRLGRPVVTTVTVDPTILGGIVCQVGDLTLDSSLRRQLELMRERLLA